MDSLLRCHIPPTSSIREGALRPFNHMHKERFGMREEFENYILQENYEKKIKDILFLIWAEAYAKGFVQGQ